MRRRTPPQRLSVLLMVSLMVLASTASALAQGSSATSLRRSTNQPTEISRFDSNLAKFDESSTGEVGVMITLDDAPLATYAGGIAGLAATSPAVTGKPLDINSAASQAYRAYLNGKLSALIASLQAKIPQAQVLYRYNVVFGGIAARIPAASVSELTRLTHVDLIIQDQPRRLETARSPQFIGAPAMWNQLGGQGSAGEGVIVGILDTGIWPEHPSLSDPDPSGKPYAPPPGGPFACEFGSSVAGDPPFTCNNKLIGGQRFMATYDVVVGLLPEEFPSTRDDNGHGTHTATTAAGNGGVAASIYGVARGTISGIAPRAHVIAYKVCGDLGCFQSDSVAAVEQAILDGVDVLNFSIGGGETPYTDLVSQAFLAAYNAGVFVAASAGNDGPGADTASHREPWVTTVGASTTDRAFKNTLTLTGGGATLSISGVSLTDGTAAPAPVVLPPGNNALCGPFTPGSVTGMIVVCQRGGNGRIEKGFNALQGGAVGMILYNQSAAVTDQETDNHFLPTTHIQFTEGQQVLAFLTAHPGAAATISAGQQQTQRGDVMASFSSRGGPGQSLGISKPDVTAPGVQILAGHTPLPATILGGPQGELFQAIAGTSMSSPHVAGAGALLRALHPDWSPGQIKSALMTSAKAIGVVKEDGVTPFTPFDAGSGRINLRTAGSPGLTFSESGANYLALQDSLWDANYPSLYIPVMPGEASVKRTAQDVTGKSDTWKLSVSFPRGQPRDFKVKVPDDLRIQAHGKRTFEIAIDARDVPLGAIRHATILIEGKRHGDATIVRFPVSFVRSQPAVELTKTCDPATIKRGSTTTCTITVANTSFTPAEIRLTDTLPSELELVRGSATGGALESRRGITYRTTVPAADPANVSVAAGVLAGYLPLADFGVAPIGGVGDETIVNFNVPSFSYAGETYSALGVDSNGYVVVGGGDGADNNCCSNQNFPDPERPNNILAPFWTDLNPGAGGAVRIEVLTDGVDDWIVVEWEAVPEFGSTTTASFQIWIGTDTGSAVEDITFAYGVVEGTGAGGFLTIGAENRFGNRGQATHFNGAGSVPIGTDLRVTTTPGSVATHVITFRAKGDRIGSYVNYAEMTSPSFFGTNIAPFQGRVIR
jgi:uncharacterized repeat protein (TIGR01451 family)